MEWLPEWAARTYAKLYYTFGTASFGFRDFRETTSSEKARAGRTIQELERSAFLYRARSRMDLRKREYYLVTPEQSVLAFAVSQDAAAVEAKVRAASRQFKCVMTGSTAAYKYHGYLTPAKTDVLIFPEDIGFWYALFKGKNVEVAIDDILPEREGEVVHLHTALTDETLSRATEVDGVLYASPEDVVLDLVRKPTERSLLEALAILLRRSNELDWDLLARSDVRQELGFLMELFNQEATREAFSESIIGRFTVPEGVVKRLSTSAQPVDVPRDHQTIARRWNLEIAVPQTVIRKAVEDLG